MGDTGHVGEARSLLEVVTDALDPGDVAAWEELDTLVRPLAAKVSREAEFSDYVLGWLYEKRARCVIRGVNTDPLWKLHTVLQDARAKGEDEEDRAGAFLSTALRKYARNDYYREIRKNRDLKFNFADPVGETGVDIENLAHPADIGPDEEIEAQEHNAAVSGHLEELRRQIDEMADSNRVALRLRYYPKFSGLEDRDLVFLSARQALLDEAERAFDPNEAPEPKRLQVEQELCAGDCDFVPFEVVGRLMGMSRDTAITACSRARKKLRAMGEQHHVD